MEIVNQEAWTIGEVMKVAQAMEDSGVSVFAVLPNQEEPRQYFVLGKKVYTAPEPQEKENAEGVR